MGLQKDDQLCRRDVVWQNRSLPRRRRPFKTRELPKAAKMATLCRLQTARNHVRRSPLSRQSLRRLERRNLAHRKPPRHLRSQTTRHRRKHDDRSRMAQMDATRLPSHLWLRVPGRQLAHRTRQPPHDFRRLSRIAMASQTDVQRIHQIHSHDYMECLANGRALELHTLFLGRRRSSPNELVRFIASAIEATKDQ